MHVTARKLGQCALCAFRASIRAPIIAQSGANRRCLTVRNSKKDSSFISYVTTRKHQTRTDRPLRIIWGGRPISISKKDLKSADDVPYAAFVELIKEQWRSLRNSLGNLPKVTDEVRNWGVTSKIVLNKRLAKFERGLKKDCARAVKLYSRTKDPPALIWGLREAFLSHNIKGLAAALKFSLINFMSNKGFSKAALHNQRMLADFRFPIEWYPRTRTLQRKIHLHVGPTNSGKTYQALQRLENAESGVYAGPLRLLAHEVYTRLNAKNKSCALITGEERRIPEGQVPYLTSCTVEMVPLNAIVDVAIIDEIQMIGDINRGWAWTQALLGLRAKEIHLCGEARVTPLIQQLCAMTGDSLEIHKYERLSPLQTMKSSLKGDLRNLEKGDAIILFSRLGIHSMRKDIESITGKRCAVVYGSLPPETRAQQASLFNDPNNDYDFLVASDAVGMGLNLNIKRIIFNTTKKMDAAGLRVLETSEIKQIAGRAGRFRTAAQALEESPSQERKIFSAEYPINLGDVQMKSPDKVGLVTALQDYDMSRVQDAMSSEAPPLATAGIAAPEDALLRFAAYFPQSTPLSYILLRLHELSSLSPRFHLCRLRDQLDIADAIQEYDLTINDRIIFISSPACFRQQGVETICKALAKCVAHQLSGELLDIKEINIDLLDRPVDAEDKEYLEELENLHNALTLYLWLSYRIAGVFRSQALAFHVKGILEEKIETCLSRVQTDPWKSKWTKLLKRRAALSSLESAPSIEQADEGEHGFVNPLTVLVNASLQKNASVSFPTYSDLERIDGGWNWRATVSVIYEGNVVQATSTGISKTKAKWNAAEIVLQKISLGQNEQASESLHEHDVSEESQTASPSVWDGNVEKGVLSKGVSKGNVKNHLPLINVDL